MAGAKYLNLSSYFRPTPPSLKVGEELNRGAYGAVHAGELNGSPVAIKKIHRLLMEAAKEDEKSWEKIIKDFEKECRLLETLEHPHIVGFWGAFYDVKSNVPILVMEKMKENLRDFLAREKINRPRQMDLCLSIARALEFLHSRSPPTVHRDLTDKNVMLSEEGVVKVGDLGQSRLKDSSVEYFNTGQPGAVPFMPPEALRPTPHYTEKIDMFSLGVLMLEVATGRQPSANIMGIGMQPEVVRRRQDLSKLSDDHPLRPIILECLKDDYKERPPAFLVCCFLESQVETKSHYESQLRVAMEMNGRFENMMKEAQSHYESQLRVVMDSNRRIESKAKDLESQLSLAMNQISHLHKQNQKHEGLRSQHEGLRQQHEGLRQQHEGLRHQFEELRQTKNKEITDLKQHPKASQTAITAVEQKLERTTEENTQLGLPLVKEGEDMRIADKREPKAENSVPTRKENQSQQQVQQSRSLSSYVVEDSSEEESSQQQLQQSRSSSYVVEDSSEEESSQQQLQQSQQQVQSRSLSSYVVEDSSEEESVLFDDVEFVFDYRGYFNPLDQSVAAAERELQGQATNGEHLVRKGGKGDLKLSVWHNRKCYHLQIYQRKDGATNTPYSLNKKDYFKSINDLCTHYKTEPLPGYSFKLRR